EILALANAPGFNPNVPDTARGGKARNQAVLDLFEPGSTFKGFLVAAALEQGAITEEETFDCEQGRYRIGRNTVHDTHRYGLLTAEEILKVSSNIGTTKIAEKVGREGLQEAYKAFGFGSRSGLLFPGEGRGRVPFPRSDIALATQSFGQGVSATALQMTSAFAALANDGKLMKPVEVRQVVRPEVARTVVRMMESVVAKGGTAPRAAVPGYRVSGKTGTAQKVDPVAGGYSDKRIASFIGTVPAEAPRLVIHVVVDEPESNVYGGIVAAPAFKEIATDTLAYLGVAPSEPVTPVLTASLPRPEAQPAVPVVSGPDP